MEYGRPLSLRGEPRAVIGLLARPGQQSSLAALATSRHRLMVSIHLTGHATIVAMFEVGS
jgi:hypothetical protein